jgi:hypothetical protein
LKTFNELQMRDPWGWCLDMIEKYNISSKMLSEAVEAPRSTVRALYNRSNRAPRYELLKEVIFLCINLENGRPGPWEIAAANKRVPVKDNRTVNAPEGASALEELSEPEEFDFL